MKYTTKSGLELPPEVVEFLKQEQNKCGYRETAIWGFTWADSKHERMLFDMHLNNDFTEFYKLYPKKDLDSYGNEIVKGEIVEVRDREEREWKQREFVCIAEKAELKYVAYDPSLSAVIMWKFCRKITEKQSLKSELQSQMNDLKAQVKEIEAKINEL